MTKTAKPLPPKKTLIGARPNDEDWRLLQELMRHLGVGESQVIRMGMRALARKEGVTP